MEIKSKFDHFNINVTNLERSIAFYEKALGLKEHHRKESSDGSFTLVYLTDGSTGFLLELTCLKEHPQAYELGENESHLCFRVSGDYDAIRQYHKENGWVCFENTAMGLYFINDPDDYWIEVLPENDIYITKTTKYMSIEEAMMGGIVFKGKKDKPKEENKIKTKAKKKTYITGQHGSASAKMKAEIRRKRANRHKK